jgi:hypothetical protein
LGFGDVGRNRETSVVVSSACPEIIEPIRNVGGSNHIIERTRREMINPGKPRRWGFWRKGRHKVSVVDV